jgi:S1-C subfamily serine protease
MRSAVTLTALALTAAGCVSVARAPDRTELIRGMLASTVQLRGERDGIIRRAASGVVIATAPGSQRAWIVTARHFIDPSPPQNIYVRLPGRMSVVPAVVAFVSPDRDLAIVEAELFDVAPARLKMDAIIGDEIFVVAFPWGQRFTVVRGIVSQVGSITGVVGSARMVSASVSYGSSGGGVFDAQTGELLGIVEGYRTANVVIPEMKERVLEVPVAGETTLISASAIHRFVVDSGLSDFLAR